MDGRRCSSAGQIIYLFDQAIILPTIKWAAEMPPFFIGKKKEIKGRIKIENYYEEAEREPVFRRIRILHPVYNMKILENR